MSFSIKKSMKLKVHFSIILILLLANELKANENDVNDGIRVSTKLGWVKGSLMNTRLGKNIYAFRGLNYAEAPTGELRFKPAVPVKPWIREFDASEEGPACPQMKGINLSENCLTLNIYTKQLQNDVEKLPVIVHIHTGGFAKFSSQSFILGPEYLLDQDIVLVTINYRLSSLGFINTGDHYAPGNLGLKDQVVALRFIRDHISDFGGNPNLVTLTGQSAGSRSIILHMVSPMSKGLFHRAIAMSGSMTTPIPPQRQQIHLAKKQAELLNCTTVTEKEMFKCMREKPAEEFGSSVNSFLEWHNNPTTIWYPSIEPDIPQNERFLSDEPENLLKAGQVNYVPLIIGVTQDEFASKATEGIQKAIKGDQSYFQELNDKWDLIAPVCFQYERNTSRSKFISDELAKFYFANKPLSLSNSDSLRQLFANAIAHFPVHRAASLLSQLSPVPVYFYEFTYQSPYSTDVWDVSEKSKGEVVHCDDLQYLFTMKNPIYFEPAKFPVFNESDREILMVKRLTSMWAHFAKTGEPLPNDSQLFGNVIWERLTPGNRSYLDIGENLILKKDFLKDTMAFWDNLFP